MDFGDKTPPLERKLSEPKYLVIDIPKDKDTVQNQTLNGQIIKLKKTIEDSHTNTP